MSSARRVRNVLAGTTLGLVLAGCSSGGGSNIATVNGQGISQADFQAKLENTPQAKAILNQLVQAALVDQYAKDNNVSIPDADVQKREDDIKSKYPPGQFDQILKTQNLTEDDVRKILRQQIVVEKAVDANIHVTDADISKYLAANHATLDTAQQVRAKHILVASPALAQQIEAQLKSGAKFEDLAKQYSTDPSSKDKGGELGFFSKGQMVPAFQDAAFKQPIGVVGPPVHSPFGYHIIVVEEKKPAQIATLANSRNKIEDTLKKQQEQQQFPIFLQGLRQKANIQINDPKLADALPPIPAGAAASGAPAPAAGAAGATSAAPAASSAAAPATSAPSPAGS